MSEVCGYAARTLVDDLKAIYIGGLLFIVARGMKPNPCVKVKVEWWPYRIWPPEYMVQTCEDPSVLCNQVETSFTAINCFAVTKDTMDAMGGVAKVHFNGDETVKVDVQMLGDIPYELFHKALTEGGTDTLPWKAGADGHESWPWSAGGHDAWPWAAHGGGGVPFPFRIGDDIGEDDELPHLKIPPIRLLPPIKLGYSTATGVSASYDFGEAFKDAVNKLPPDPRPYPDKMLKFDVINVGARVGGLIGFNQLEVTVGVFY